MSIPRVAFLRSVMMNHLYHHRGQLSVYLRILDVPVPSIYGPSADEKSVRVTFVRKENYDANHDAGNQTPYRRKSFRQKNGSPLARNCSSPKRSSPASAMRSVPDVANCRGSGLKPTTFSMGQNGKVSLSDLIQGKSQLVIYHFMLGPDWKEGCPSCSYLADHFGGSLVHLNARDVAFSAVSRARWR